MALTPQSKTKIEAPITKPELVDYASGRLMVRNVTLIFPFIDEPRWLWLIVVWWVVNMIAMDLKASTFPLLNIDCVPRHLLAQANSVFTIAGGIVGFVAMPIFPSPRNHRPSGSGA